MGPRRCATVLFVLFAVAVARAQSSRPESAPVLDDARIAAARAAVENADRERGETSMKAASARKALAQALFQADRIEEGVEADRQVLAILEQNAAATQSNLAHTRIEIAAMLYRLDRPDEALPFARAAVENAVNAFGGADRRTAKMYYVLAGIEEVLGRYAQAEEAIGHALEVYRDPKTADARELASALHGLAEIFIHSGRCSDARSLLQEAIQIAKSNPAIPPSTEGRCEGLLGVLEDTLGRYGDARKHFERQYVLLVADKDARPDDLAMTLGNIAHTAVREGDLQVARDTFERAVALCEEKQVGRHLGYVLQEYAVAVLMSGDAAKAEILATRSVAVERASPEANPIRLGRALKVLALTQHANGRAAEALPTVEAAIALFGPAYARKRTVASALEAKGRILSALGRPDDARAVFREAIVNARAWLSYTTGTLSESERLSALNQIRSMIDGWLSLALSKDPDAAAISSEVLAWQGQVLRGLETQREWLRAHAAAPQMELRSRLARIDGELAPEHLMLPRARRAPRTSALIAERERIERELAAPASREDARDPGADELAAALGPDEALVDYFVYNRTDTTVPIYATQRNERALAIVLRRGQPPAVVDLGALRAVRDAAAAHLTLVSRLVKPDPAAQPIVDAAADALRRVLWEPVAGLVRDKSRIFVVPDSFIAAIPFETLPGAKSGSYLVEEKSFVYLPVAAERAPRPRKPVGRGALLVGDVAFGANGHDDGSEVAAIRSALGLPLAPLPKTADEVAAVAASLERATGAPAAIKRLTGDAATETAVKQDVAGRRFVHFATHAILAMERRTASNIPESRATLRIPTAVAALAPLTRAAIALAGVNERGGSGADDGLLTAAEVTWLDLGECELVTLSGCESGLGAFSSGESLLGLRRAFHLAGARATVTAVWRIEDQDAADLMTAFYDGLLIRKLGKAAALREAQISLLERNRSRHAGAGLPGTWGAFVLDGDWE